MQRALIEGKLVLVVVDIQGGESNVDDDGDSVIPLMAGYDAAMAHAPVLIDDLTRRDRVRIAGPLKESARPHKVAIVYYGEMAERTIASVLKTVEPLRVPGVRIPLSPLLPGGRHKAAPSVVLLAEWSRLRRGPRLNRGVIDRSPPYEDRPSLRPHNCG